MKKKIEFVILFKTSWKFKENKEFLNFYKEK